MRAKAIADGQQVEIPVLHMIRTVGTRERRKSRERKARSKRRSRHIGKTVWQGDAVTGSELLVAKLPVLLSRKAAIVSYVPVP